MLHAELPIYEKDFAPLRRELMAILKDYASNLPTQAIHWQEKAFLAYLRTYVHPQATWQDARLIAAKIAYSPQETLTAHPLPFNLLSAYQRGLTHEFIHWPHAPWLFHRSAPKHGWQLPKPLAQLLASSTQGQVLFPFASHYEQPWIEALAHQDANSKVISATWADAYSLAFSNKEQTEVYWANALCLPLTQSGNQAIFEAKNPWRKNLEALAHMPFNWICLNACQWPLERFERGNQRLFEPIDAAIANSYEAENLWDIADTPSLALRQLCWATLRLREQANLLVLMPPDFLHSPAWNGWRNHAVKNFAQILVMDLPTCGMMACWCLQKPLIEHLPLGYADSTESWAHEAFKPMFVHQEGLWYREEHQQFWAGLALMPPYFPLKNQSKNFVSLFEPAYLLTALPTGLSGLTEEEARTKLQIWLTSQSAEEAVNYHVQERAVHSLVTRWVACNEQLPKGMGLYWANPQSVQALKLPPASAFDHETQAWWLPYDALSKKALKHFKQYYWKQVPLPTGLAKKEALLKIKAIEVLSQQLPVLQKFTNQLNDAIEASSAVLPYALFPQLREIMERYHQKITQLYPSARERKSLFERLGGLLQLLERLLQESEEAYAQAEALRAEVTAENIYAYAFAVLREPSYQNHYLPRIPLFDDFWGYAKQGQALLNPGPVMQALSVEMAEDVPPSLPLLLLYKEKGLLKIDSQCQISGLTTEMMAVDAQGKSPLMQLLALFRKRYIGIETPYEWLPYRAQLLEALHQLASRL